MSCEHEVCDYLGGTKWKCIDCKKIIDDKQKTYDKKLKDLSNEIWSKIDAL